ncbi:MAG: TetR family transcriptional regulator [Solirubrobacterales bacterium]|nr:TetR family transcriptional regulator [Solirubrobacterales bacterium]
MPENPPAPRERLSAERIVEEALELAKQEGVRGISMRPLAARFGVSATALYGHIDSRDALLSMMLDRVLDGVPALGEDLGWEETLRAGALQMREAFGSYPQLALEALGGNATSEHARANGENVRGQLGAAGFDEATANLVATTWARYTLSFLAAAEHVPEGNEPLREEAYELGLDVMLAGLRAKLAG